MIRDYSYLRSDYQREINYCDDLEIGDIVTRIGCNESVEVKARNERYIILVSKSYYGIIDLERIVVGPHDLIFNPYNFDKQEDIDEYLMSLINEDIEVSHRNSVALDVTW